MSSSSSKEWIMHQLQERRMRPRMRIRKNRQAYGKNEDNEDWISEREVDGETEDDGDMISERKRIIREVDAENEDNGDRISKRKIYIREVDAENKHNGDRISERKINIAREVDGENEEHGPDRISALPDCLLVDMINFMDTKSAVQTCVLSKRWRDLSKCLSNLTFHSDLPSECLDRSFKKFESWVLSSRDDSYPLLNLTIESWIDADVQDRVIKYALLRNVQKLKMNINSTTYRPNFRSLPLIFCSRSLTSLELSNKLSPSKLKLPKSLHLPALKSLHLAYVTFNNSDKDRVEPFSNCPVLNTLVLRNFSLNAQVLSISNSTLSSLTIFEGQACSIVLSTPNLSSFSITGSVGHQLSSTFDLSFLGEVNIYMPWSEGSLDGKSSIIIKWLEVLANVKILTIGLCAIQTILHDLLNPISTRPQPPKFVRLESLKVKVGNSLSAINTSDEKVTRAVEYLLQNSPMPRFDIIRSA